MHRRSFMKSVAEVALFPALSQVTFPQHLVAADAPADLKITGVIGFVLRTKRPKMVGKNAYKNLHGEYTHDRMLRIQTNAGSEGFGHCSASREQCAELLGKNPFDLFDKSGLRMAGPLGRATMPLWDLVGKTLKQPVWKLLGAAGPERVPVYDGSIYFADLLPEYAASWQDRFRREIEMGLERGHRFFKVKIGRGHKWMPRAAGDDRDVEVVTLIARHGGKEIGIGVDGNNGYDRAGAQRFVERVGDVNLAFVEEMFPESVEECLRFKEFLANTPHKTLLADGESAAKVDDLRPYIEARAIDVLQADMNHFGIEEILAEAALAKPQGLRIAPHNWGSVLGFYEQLHVGRAIANFYRAEQDPADSAVLVADGYKIENGFVRVPDAPGFGLALNPAKLKEIANDFSLSL